MEQVFVCILDQRERYESKRGNREPVKRKHLKCQTVMMLDFCFDCRLNCQLTRYTGVSCLIMTSKEKQTTKRDSLSGLLFSAFDDLPSSCFVSTFVWKDAYLVVTAVYHTVLCCSCLTCFDVPLAQESSCSYKY